MKRYIEHLKTRSTHERREFSMQAAGVITALLLLIWLATLSLRLVSSGESEQMNTENTAATLLSY